MSDLRKNFCPSPWLHMRINNTGNYEYCRWASKEHKDSNCNISNMSPDVFFQEQMTDIRKQLLNGELPAGCTNCALMEKHNKVSGRQKQLLKIGVRVEQFDKMLMSSPWVGEFNKNGNTSQLPQDWQIDLGNYCNSSCVFCTPESSSRLATEFKKIGIVNDLPPMNWTDNPALVQQFVDTLIKSPHIQYLHFIGGETLITPAFKIILEALINAKLNHTATLGFTTNLITWDDEVVELLTQFSGVNLGMSIEAFDDVNDYVRWPATMPKIYKTINRWIELAKQHQWLLQFRTTPTVLSVGKLLTVYEYAWQHDIAIESCNFLARPEFMRPSVLPMQQRLQIINQMEEWIVDKKSLGEKIINIRDPNVAKQQIVQDLQSYINYLRDEPEESYRLPDLVQYIKKLESNRGNSILTYLPEYEELFRTAGY